MTLWSHFLDVVWHDFKKCHTERMQDCRGIRRLILCVISKRNRIRDWVYIFRCPTYQTLCHPFLKLYLEKRISVFFSLELQDIYKAQNCCLNKSIKLSLHTTCKIPCLASLCTLRSPLKIDFMDSNAPFESSSSLTFSPSAIADTWSFVIHPTPFLCAMMSFTRIILGMSISNVWPSED